MQNLNTDLRLENCDREEHFLQIRADSNGEEILIGLNILFKNEKIAFKNVYWGILLGIPNYFSMLFLVKTLSYFPTASATIFPINNIGIVAVSTMVSVWFFKEKLNSKNIIGLLLSLTAIALIAIKF